MQLSQWPLTGFEFQGDDSTKGTLNTLHLLGFLDNRSHLGALFW